jgi:hypothetical protein
MDPELAKCDGPQANRQLRAAKIRGILGIAQGMDWMCFARLR